MPEYDKLDKLREEIDKIDEQIIELISQRLKLSGDIGTIKSKISKPIIDKEREADLNTRMHNLCRQKGLNSELVLKIWQLILNESYRAQNVDK